jgi:hypothetical protein
MRGEVMSSPRLRSLAATLGAAVAIVLVAIVVRTVTDTPDENADRQAPPPTSTTSTPSRTSSAAPDRACGEVLAETRDGYRLTDYVRAMATAVHEAACRHDYDALLAQMDPAFEGGTAVAKIAELRALTPEGAALDVLAATLETAPTQDQGGTTYCQQGGAEVGFPRGTINRPGRWNRFELLSGTDPAACGP